jgi:myosin heavy subunit
MTALTHLHEPGVLANLRQRYAGGTIYTYTGAILIAVNPFTQLPGLYGRAQMDAYASGGPDALGRLPPHVYAVASDAYRKMRSEGRGQAILVSCGCVGWGRSRGWRVSAAAPALSHTRPTTACVRCEAWWCPGATTGDG